MLSPVLEVPTGLCGFGAGEVNGCPFCADFYSCLLLSVGCSVSGNPNKQSHKYLHTQGFSQRLLHLPALPQPASLSTVFPGHLVGEDRNSGFGHCLMAGSVCSAEKSHFVTACGTVPRLKV